MNVSTHQIGYGDYGVSQTVEHMRALVDAALDNPRVVMLARQIAAMGGRRQYMQALTIQGWLKRVWRFVDDPTDRDILISPELSLQEFANTGYITGDCDEAATVGATLGRAVGLGAEFCLLGFASDDPALDGRLAHVFAVLLTDDGRRVSLDVTKPAGTLPNPSRIVTVSA